MLPGARICNLDRRCLIPSVMRNLAPILAALTLLSPSGYLLSQAPQAFGLTAASAQASAGAPPVRGRGRRGSTVNNAAGNDRANAREKATGDRPLLPIATLSNSLGVPSGTPIRVRLASKIDSAHVKNGDVVGGKLEAPVGGMPVGTPVELTVISAAPAGKIQSFGELSVQLLSVGGHPLLSEMINTQGKEGHKELPDAAPAKGTEAVFSDDQPLTFPAA